ALELQQNNITEQEMVRSQTFPHNIVSVQITTFVSNLAGAGSGSLRQIEDNQLTYCFLKTGESSWL
ncbi:hypothetical protein, partial [Shigella flexneri]|uniref:hypothetical protein n=1 Tax=Shigella flexneri TaxID=623 RepID=UPI002491EB51